MAKKSPKDALVKKLGVGVAGELEALSEEELSAAIVEASQTIQETQEAMGEDEKLTGAKEIVKDLAGGYREVIGAQRAKVAYCLHLRGDGGGAVRHAGKSKKGGG